MWPNEWLLLLVFYRNRMKCTIQYKTKQNKIQYNTIWYDNNKDELSTMFCKTAPRHYMTFLWYKSSSILWILVQLKENKKEKNKIFAAQTRHLSSLISRPGTPRWEWQQSHFLFPSSKPFLISYQLNQSNLLVFDCLAGSHQTKSAKTNWDFVSTVARLHSTWSYDTPPQKK